MTSQENRGSGQEQRPQPATSQDTGLSPNLSPEERDERIKNEPDTRRLRSEQQSVADGEQDTGDA